MMFVALNIALIYTKGVKPIRIYMGHTGIYQWTREQPSEVRHRASCLRMPLGRQMLTTYYGGSNPTLVEINTKWGFIKPTHNR